mmetsp:Transcript_10976/g.32502  ORF Transcript_10976/g.32502 Transcript_10976/m.32502 type:complete len:265 (+) Transcript_10976:57-851(+)
MCNVRIAITRRRGVTHPPGLFRPNRPSGHRRRHDCGRRKRSNHAHHGGERASTIGLAPAVQTTARTQGEKLDARPFPLAYVANPKKEVPILPEINLLWKPSAEGGRFWLLAGSTPHSRLQAPPKLNRETKRGGKRPRRQRPDASSVRHVRRPESVGALPAATAPPSLQKNQKSEDDGGPHGRAAAAPDGPDPVRGVRGQGWRRRTRVLCSAIGRRSRFSPKLWGRFSCRGTSAEARRSAADNGTKRRSLRALGGSFHCAARCGS